MVQGFIAGGDRALRHAVEGCEDSAEDGEALIDELAVGENDAVVGITPAAALLCIGRPAAREGARRRGHRPVHERAHAPGGGLRRDRAPLVGPEVITGSTRLKSGTAQKMVLNMFTTCAMIKLGKVLPAT